MKRKKIDNAKTNAERSAILVCYLCGKASEDSLVGRRKQSRHKNGQIPSRSSSAYDRMDFSRHHTTVNTFKILQFDIVLPNFTFLALSKALYLIVILSVE